MKALTFCENVGFSPQQTERVFQAAQALGIPVKATLQLSSLGGAQLVSRYHGLSADHIEYLTEEGVAAMRESGTVAALLPGAFYFLNETVNRRSSCAYQVCRWRWRPISTPAPALRQPASGDEHGLRCLA